jgi:hypothetical protein
VNNALIVRCAEPFTHLNCKLNDALLRKRAVAPQQMPQILSIRPGHGDKAQPVRLAQVMNAQHVPVRDLAGKRDFVLQP